VPVAFGSENILLDALSGLPIPDRVNTLRLGTGVGYRFNEQWMAVLSLGPVLYRLEDIEGDDFGFAGMVRANYRIRQNLTASFGLAFNPDSDVPVFPALGLRWEIRTNVILNLTVPKPGVIYRATPKMSLFAGGGFKGATFRTDPTFGASIGNPGSIMSWPAIGCPLGPRRGLWLHAASLRDCGRRLFGVARAGLQDLDETVRFAPAPYVQAGLRFRF